MYSLDRARLDGIRLNRFLTYRKITFIFEHLKPFRNAHFPVVIHNLDSPIKTVVYYCKNLQFVK